MSTFLELRENERKLRKKLIIEATMALFEEKPFHDIGMRDIAEKAGVSAATIYRYFPNQDDLFVETLIQEISNIEKTFEARVNENGFALDEMASSFIDYLVDNEATFQLMSHFMMNSHINSETLEKYNVVQRYFLKFFDTVLQKEGLNDNVRLYSHTFFASLAGIVMSFRNYPGRTQEEIKKHMHRLADIMTAIFKQNHLLERKTGS